MTLAKYKLVVKSYRDGEAHTVWFGLHDLNSGQWYYQGVWHSAAILPYTSRKEAEEVKRIEELTKPHRHES